MSIVWLLALGLTVGGLGILARTSHGWHVRRADLGWMSQQWLAQYRSNGR
ncbi:MAG: hypothetical protein ACM3NQ_01370 [Bacteroidales bacterium]